MAQINGNDFREMFNDQERSIGSSVMGSSILKDSNKLTLTHTREKKLSKHEDKDEVTSKYREDKGGGGSSATQKHKYNGRYYKIHTGPRGGKHIVVNNKKIYI